MAMALSSSRPLRLPKPSSMKRMSAPLTSLMSLSARASERETMNAFGGAEHTGEPFPVSKGGVVSVLVVAQLFTPDLQLLVVFKLLNYAGIHALAVSDFGRRFGLPFLELCKLRQGIISKVRE